MNDQGGVGAEGAVSDIEASSAAVDHALLESLFYNEMMMLNPSSPGPTFLSHHITEATHLKPQQAQPSVDPNTFVEKEILRDFGVSASPVRTSTHQLYAPQEGIASTSHVSQSWDVAPAQHPQHMYIAPAGPVPDIAPKHAPTDYATHDAPHGSIYRSYPPETAAASQPASSYEQRPPLSVDTYLPPSKNVPRDRTKMLVDQFATLANRLGIDLPNNVLQSLTAAAAKNGPGLPCATLQSAPDDPTSSLDLKQPVLDEDSSDSAGPSTLHELRKTAEEAIASVTKKRPLDTEDVGNGNVVSRHGKRKKKPRLADCESRLAELRSENDLLKRHLENVSNKAHRFDQEKEAAGKRIHALLEQNAGQEEMNAAVREFSEMYSDYGKNRQNELHFHLEQLQRLVNPTNFTKMGLWTLGQSVSPKQNPIAGILQKELDITPQQGRKILDQSEKIKALCENLKECLALLAKLKGLCQQKTQIFQDRMDKCREILTTKQTVQLIKWIDDHTDLLETVCPGWGTEHIHSSASKHA